MNRTLIVAGAAVLAIVAIGFGALGGFGRDGLGGSASSAPPSMADPVLTADPSVAEPTTSSDAFLPEGPLVVWDSPSADEPSIAMTISATGWIYHASFSAIEKGEEVDNVPEAFVLPGTIAPGAGLSVPEDPCRSGSTMPQTPATTPGEIVDALADQASRAASEPVDVTVGGYAGKMLTLHVPDDADFADCEGGEYVSYADEAGKPWQWHQGPGQIDDFWFVDVEGSLVEIRASYRSDTPAELVAEMRAIVESATFEFP
jgi:hypothetical protein